MASDHNLQQDLITLRLDPRRPNIDGPRELFKLIGRKWPGRGDDPRPFGWGWEQVHAYSRVHGHLIDQERRSRAD